MFFLRQITFLISTILIFFVIVELKAETVKYDEWYLINSRGNNIGYTRITIKETNEKFWELTKETRIKVRFLIMKFDINSQEAVCFNSKGKLISFNKTNIENKITEKIVGNIKNDTLLIEYLGKTEKKVIELNQKEYDFTTNELELLILTSITLLPKKDKQLKVFNFETASIIFGFINDKGKQKVKYNNKSKEVRVIEKWFGRNISTIYLDDTGKEIKEFGKDFELILSTKDKIEKTFK